MNSQDSKTLQELDGVDWGEPPYQSSLVVNCHRLRRVPLRDFRIEDLDLMIRQNISLNWLIPVALQRLADDPWVAEVEFFFPGDLLRTVLEVPQEFWKQHDDLRHQLIEVLKSATGQIDVGEDFYTLPALRTAVAVPREFWEQHDDLRQQLIDMLQLAIGQIEHDWPWFADIELKNAAKAKLAELLSPRSDREFLK
jgi:hypothetical protein